MEHVRYDLGSLAAGTGVEVTLDQQANVHLLDAANLSRYERDEGYTAIGGLMVQSPALLQVPSPGRWFVVIDLGGNQGTVSSSVRTIAPG
jgi:hypothetical protein